MNRSKLTKSVSGRQFAVITGRLDQAYTLDSLETTLFLGLFALQTIEILSLWR
jgi:hypothetical protein